MVSFQRSGGQSGDLNKLDSAGPPLPQSGEINLENFFERFGDQLLHMQGLGKLMRTNSGPPNPIMGMGGNPNNPMGGVQGPGAPGAGVQPLTPQDHILMKTFNITGNYQIPIYRSMQILTSKSGNVT